MGPGGSQDAAFDLKGSVPAGTYHIVADAVIMSPVDVELDLIHRRGGVDTVLATRVDHYEPLPGGVYTAQPFDYDAPAPALDFAAGDQFVFRYKAVMATGPEAYIPNGDGGSTSGRIPNIRLPK